MSSSSKSLGEEARDQGKRAIQDPLERQAIELLDRAGWTHGELAMCFEIGQQALTDLLDEERSGDRLDDVDGCEAQDCDADRRLEAVDFEDLGVERVYCPKHREGVAIDLCGRSAREL